MRRLAVYLILTCGLLAFASVGMAAHGEDREAAEFWATERVHTIHIRITAQQWRMMEPVRKQGRQRIAASAVPPPSTQPSTRPVLVERPPETQPAPRVEGQRLRPNFYGMEFAYVKADFECDGIKLNNVGFRERGNSSFNWSASGYKRPYKVDFNHFVDGQKLYGLTGFHLNNLAYDPSLLREALSYELFRSLGVPAPRTTFALVYMTIEGRLSHEYLGLYTLIEEIDSKAFLRNQFGSAQGMLLKPWSIVGLPYLGEQWEAYESRYTSKSNLTVRSARRTIDFIKLVNYADDDTFRRQIDQYLNVDEFLRLLAGQVLLANLDCFLFTGHNFYMYLNPADDRFYLMPWDLNLAFANFTTAGSIDQLVHLSILRPHSGEAKIVDRLLAIPQYKEAYLGHIRQAMQTCFKPERISARVDALQAVIAQADAAADAAWAARFPRPATNPATQPARIPPRPPIQLTGWQGQPAIPLKTFATRRIDSLREQLAGETDGYTPGYRRPPMPPPGGLHASAAYGNLPLIAFAVMRGADTNCDGKLTRSEAKAAVQDFFAESTMDQAKLTSSLAQALQQAMSRRYERGNHGSRGQMRPADVAGPWCRAILATADKEKSGRVALPQALAAAEQAFTQADKDKSGKLDDIELLELLDSLASVAPPPVAVQEKAASAGPRQQ